MAKRILMICYYYPPLLDVGCRRSVGFSKYLKKHGWIPYVLSVKNADRTYCLIGNDRPPEGVFVKYTYSIVNPYRLTGKLNGLFTKIMRLFNVKVNRNYFYDLLCIPDLSWGWIPLTAIDGLKIIRQKGIDFIYASCPPFSSGIIGVLLKKLTNKPFILDFRDPFALEQVRSSNAPIFRRKIDQKIEEWLLNQADILIVASEEMRTAYISRYPISANKVFTVHNGVDTNLIKNDPSISKYHKFTIVYAGLFFYTKHEWDPEFFFQALAILKKKGIISSKKFQFLFYGEGKEQVDEIADKLGVKDLVIANYRLSYGAIVDIIRKSHFQLVRNRNLVIPSKLYDGIALNVPFLATIPGGEAAEIIKQYSPSSYIITHESSDEVATAIIDAISKYERNDIKNNHVSSFISEFSREHLSIKLMDIIKQTMPQKRGAV